MKLEHEKNIRDQRKPTDWRAQGQLEVRDGKRKSTSEGHSQTGHADGGPSQ